MSTIDPASFVIETEPPSSRNVKPRSAPPYRRTTASSGHAVLSRNRVEKTLLRWLLIVACVVFIWDRIEPRPTVIQFMTSSQIAKQNAKTRKANDAFRKTDRHQELFAESELYRKLLRESGIDG